MALSGGFLIGLFFLSRLAASSRPSTGSSATWRPTWCSPSSCCSRPTSAARWRTSAAPRSSATSSARTSADETVEELVTAATTLSRASASARSSSIERQIGLRNYIEGGIPLDATVTYDLLASIFQPGSPLHDGAVIVQGDRIAAAACFLPLSVNPRVSRELGTRHRAALGLTEENDAVAIVVSEETGTISLAIGGGSGARPDGRDAAAAAAHAARLRRPRRGVTAATDAAEARSPDGGHRASPHRAEGRLGRAGRAAVAARVRRADRRARAAHSARVHQPAAAARAGRRAAQRRGRARARLVRAR